MIDVDLEKLHERIEQMRRDPFDDTLDLIDQRIAAGADRSFAV